jgi:hypothetical protein
VIPTSGRKF